MGNTINIVSKFIAIPSQKIVVAETVTRGLRIGNRNVADAAAYFNKQRKHPRQVIKHCEYELSLIHI